MSESESKSEPDILERLGIQWKDKLTAAEWLAEQSDAMRAQYNSWIRLMTKSTREGRLSDKQIRLLPIDDFFALVRDFLTKFGLMTEQSFFEK